MLPPAASVEDTAVRAAALATEMAEALGLTTSQAFRRLPSKQHSILINQLTATAAAQEDVWPIVIPNFCARFLPSLVAAYKTVPGTRGVYWLALLGATPNQYFAKFMRGGLAPDLYVFYVNHLLDNTIWKRGGHDSFRESFRLLRYLMIYASLYPRAVDALPEKTEQKLGLWICESGVRSGEALNIILKRTKRSKKGDTLRSRDYEIECHRDVEQWAYGLMQLLTGRMNTAQFLHDQHTVVPWVTCNAAEEHCESDHGHPLKERGRRECVRCQTVAYCSKEHQRVDWPQHKLYCFETNY
ncbi:hypothetical protein B0H11DRAFT_2307163 [Mycena galericulata]|nr:hypothetical protein B0H11DRAFT_2307163 [Mycena galericulata]